MKKSKLDNRIHDVKSQQKYTEILMFLLRKHHKALALHFEKGKIENVWMNLWWNVVKMREWDKIGLIGTLFDKNMMSIIIWNITVKQN